MPLFDVICADCGHAGEILVLGSEAPACPACGSARLERTPPRTAPPPRSKALLKAARAQAKREGHLSHFGD